MSSGAKAFRLRQRLRRFGAPLAPRSRRRSRAHPRRRRSRAPPRARWLALRHAPQALWAPRAASSPGDSRAGRGCRQRPETCARGTPRCSHRVTRGARVTARCPSTGAAGWRSSLPCITGRACRWVSPRGAHRSRAGCAWWSNRGCCSAAPSLERPTWPCDCATVERSARRSRPRRRPRSRAGARRARPPPCTAVGHSRRSARARRRRCSTTGTRRRY